MSMPSVWTVPGVILFVICKSHFLIHLVPLCDSVLHFVEDLGFKSYDLMKSVKIMVVISASKSAG